jgi:peptide/nickel transport system substrate-binding protein
MSPVARAQSEYAQMEGKMGNRITGSSEGFSLLDGDTRYSRRRIIQLMGVVGAGFAAAPLLSACEDDDTDDVVDTTDDSDDTDPGVEPDDDADDTEPDVDPADDEDDEPVDDDDDAMDDDAEVEPQRGGTLQWYLPDDPPDLDPHQQTTSSLQWICGMCYNGLLKFDVRPGHGPDSEGAATPVPDLAESYDVSDDGLEYVFHLREGVLFHDGEEFTAEDAAFSIDRIRSDGPEFQRAYAFTPVASAEATDTYELTVTMNELYAAFINQVAVAYTRMAPKHVIEEEGDMRGVIVGTGPFMLREYQRGQSMILDANPDYFDGDIPYLDAIEITIMPDASTRLSSFMAGQLDIFRAGSVSELETVQGTVDDVQLQEFAGFGLSGMAVNIEVEPLDDIRVRQAIWYAIDQDEIRRVVLQGRGEANRRAVPPDMVGWAVPFEELPLGDAPNLERSRELLEEAGYPDGFDITIKTVYRYTQEEATVASEMLREVGINAEIIDVEYGAFLDERNTGDFELMALGLAPFGDIEDVTAALYHSEASRNYGNWGLPELDELFEAGQREIDVEARQEIFREVQMILAEQCWFIDFPRTNVFDLSQSYVRDFVAGQNPQRGLGFHYIWLDQ